MIVIGVWSVGSGQRTTFVQNILCLVLFYGQDNAVVSGSPGSSSRVHVARSPVLIICFIGQFLCCSFPDVLRPAISARSPHFLCHFSCDSSSFFLSRAPRSRSGAKNTPRCVASTLRTRSSVEVNVETSIVHTSLDVNSRGATVAVKRRLYGDESTD